MAQGKSFLETKNGRVVMNYAYCLGAAVVIIGAWAKILHLSFANIMLTVGLLTEAFIFIISSFEPQYVDKHYDWERVYPELEAELPKDKSKGTVTQQLDKMLSENKVGADLIGSLGRGLTNLSDSVNKMNDITDASVAAADFSKNAKAASGSITSFAQAAAQATSAVGEIGKGSEHTKQYHEQVQSMVKNLSQLNAIYELELQDSNNHLKAMNKFFGNLNSAAQALSETANDAVKYKEELSRLNKNLSSLNAVYGNMLSAMKAQ